MISSADIAQGVHRAILEAAVTLRPDVVEALERARKSERSERGQHVLDQLAQNARIAERDRVPLCQDTGTVWIRIELGSEDCMNGDIQAAIDDAVASAYAEGALRMSVAKDALSDRSNTGNNTPAFVEIVSRPGTGATVHVMLKGGGSDNSSAVAMLEPADGVAGIERFVLDTVSAKVIGACPPVVIGVGIGATFDKVGGLAKMALLRPLSQAARTPDAAALQERLLAAVNSTGIGPAGLGGDTTALAVQVVTAPCHIAALPVAVNMGCSAMRSVTFEVAE